MPYEQEISCKHKALFVFLLNQSAAMEETFTNSGNRMMDGLATALNAKLENLVMACTSDNPDEPFKDRMDISVIGYRTDSEANAIIESPLKPELRDRDYISIVEIANAPEIGLRTEQYHDEETGEIMQEEAQFPIWVRPVAEGGTPMCTALHRAYEVVDGWIDEENHSESFPPIVIHITEGENNEDADPLDYAKPLKELTTNDGNVLLFNCNLSWLTSNAPILFPNSDALLPCDFTRMLYQMSSELLEPMFENAIAKGYDLVKGARGMVSNADLVELIKFLDVTTAFATDSSHFRLR